MCSVAGTEEELHAQLFECCEKGDITSLKQLLEPPLTVDTILNDIYVVGKQSTRKPTLLVAAAAFSQLEIVEYLLSRGANPNISDKRQRFPLHFAAMTQNIDIMRSLLAAKAEVNKQDWDNYAPLHYCAKSGFIAGAKALLDEGASINIQTRLKETPLVLALSQQQNDMIQFLINSRADVRKPDVIHRPPISYAREPQAVKILADSGADVNMPDDDGLSPAHWAVLNHCLIFDALKKCGSDINAIDINKRTPLHLAALTGYEEGIVYLLVAGANYHAVDIDHNTPESTARANNFLGLTIIFTTYIEQEQNGKINIDKLMEVANEAKPAKSGDDRPSY